MGQLKRKSDMSPERRRMLESLRCTVCSCCDGEKKPMAAFCKDCLARLDMDSQKVLKSPFHPDFEVTWLVASADGCSGGYRLFPKEAA